MTSKVKIFQNVFADSSTGLWITFCGQIWWKSAIAKLPKGRVDYHTQKTPVPRHSSSPYFPKMGRLRPRFPERCHPLTCPRITNLVQIGCVLSDLSRKDLFFGTKSQYNIGFQPTIITFKIKNRTILQQFYNLWQKYTIFDHFYKSGSIIRSQQMLHINSFTEHQTK